MTPVVASLLAQAQTLPDGEVADVIEALIVILDARTPDAEAEPDDDGEPDADGYVLTLLRDPGHAETLRNEAFTGWPERYHGEDMEPEEPDGCEAGEDLGTIPEDHPQAYRWRQDTRNAGRDACYKVRDFVHRLRHPDPCALPSRRKEQWA